MFKYASVAFITLSATLAFAQNPAGPRGGNEPLPTTLPAKSNATKQTEGLPPAASDKHGDQVPMGQPVVPTADVSASSTSGGSHNFGIFAGINVPHALTYGLDYRHSSRLWGASIGAGTLDAEVEDVKAKMDSQEITARYFPWRSAFYVGLGYGKHEINASKTELIQGQNITVKASVDANYITPQVGWHWATSFGLTWGFEVGYLSPSGAKTEIDPGTTNPAVLNDPEYIALKKDAEDQGDKFGNTGLPFVTLLRVGYQF